MHTAQIVSNNVIADVMKELKDEIARSGLDQSVLSELRKGWEEHLNRQGRLRDMAVDVGDRQQLVPSQYVADRQTVAQLRADPRAIQRAATAAERISDIPPIANTDIYKGGGYSR